MESSSDAARLSRAGLFASAALAALHCFLVAVTSNQTISRGINEISKNTSIKEDFQLQIMHHVTDRQQGAKLNVFARYRYLEARYGQPTITFDYRDARRLILTHLDTETSNVPKDAFWEELNKAMAIDAMERLPIRGICIVIQVQGMSSGGIEGHRSSIVTVGDMEPLQLENRFWDCTGEIIDESMDNCGIAASKKDPPKIPSKWNQLFLLIQSTGVAAVIWLFIASASYNTRHKSGAEINDVGLT